MNRVDTLGRPGCPLVVDRAALRLQLGKAVSELLLRELLRLTEPGEHELEGDRHLQQLIRRVLEGRVGYLVAVSPPGSFA